MAMALTRYEPYSIQQSYAEGIPDLALASFALRFQAQTSIAMPAFAGSLWRGILGTAVHDQKCTTAAPDCAGCLVTERCVYHRIFQRGFNETRGYVVHPSRPGQGRFYHEREAVSVGLTLFGGEAECLDDWLKPLEHIRDYQVGRSAGRLRLLQIVQLHSDGQQTLVYDEGWRDRAKLDRLPALPTLPQQVAIQLETPLRIKREGQILDATQISGQDFLQAVLKRYRYLVQFHSGRSQSLNEARLERQMQLLRCQWQRVSTYRLARKSRRYQKPMNQDGVLGRLQIEGPGLEAWWPLLWVGQYLNVGKSAAMGMGRYRVEMVKSM